MGIKNRILSIVSIMALAIILTFVGVWAVADLDFAVGGDITYTAPETPGVNIEEVSYLIVEFDDTNMTAQIVDCYVTDNIPIPAVMDIPEIIKNNGKSYTVTIIGYGAFDNRPEITSVSIPDSVISIEGAAFEYCENLSDVTIGNGVISIGEAAFSSCYIITSITIPKNVTSIGAYAFHSCTSLAEVIVEATTPPTGGESIFGLCASSLVIYVPSESESAYRRATNWKSYYSKIQAGNF